jgi:secondary thiamine-phosphate synthase enzyme
MQHALVELEPGELAVEEEGGCLKVWSGVRRRKNAPTAGETLAKPLRRRAVVCYASPMRSFRKVITLHVKKRMEFVNITPEVEAALGESGIREGLCLVNSMHITSSVFINDDESGLHEDYARWLERLAPYDPSPERYHHNRTGEDNGDAHHKRQVMGREVVVAVTAGKLDFGTWEQIFYGEFDGKRAKRILIKIIGE